jgi:tripartite-type tricarboxylate transporter receptor subunit TctC
MHGAYTGVAVLAAAVAMGPGAAVAQKYPDRPIRLIVQSPAGGTADLIARVIGQKLGESVGQSVVIDNRAGAAGTVSAELTAQAAPDGYTLLVASVSLMAINVTLREGKLSYNPEKDFTHIALTGKVPLAISVLPAFPARSFKEFVAHAKTRPGKLSYGSAGTGSSNHVVGELLKTETGIDLVHVPFKGGAPAMAALLANQLDVYIATVPTIVPMVQAGRIRAIAVSSQRRSPALPEVPTMAESGLPGFDTTSWFCIVGPARIAQPVVTRLNGEIVSILNAPDVRERLIAAGVNVETGTPAELSAFVRAEIAKMRKSVKFSGATVD